MAKLYFRYGAMGCSKTANALMVAFNYEEKGLKPLVLKPKLENRDGEKIIKSRIGLQRTCDFVEDFIYPYDYEATKHLLKDYDCIIVDEVQFCKPEEIRMLWTIMNELKIPAICYGLSTDFQNNLFPASKELMILADVKEELKTVCWCGDGAKCNARLNNRGEVVRTGEQIQMGGNESYTSLCLKHYTLGDIGPKMRAKFKNNINIENHKVDNQNTLKSSDIEDFLNTKLSILITNEKEYVSFIRSLKENNITIENDIDYTESPYDYDYKYPYFFIEDSDYVYMNANSNFKYLQTRYPDITCKTIDEVDFINLIKETDEIERE